MNNSKWTASDWLEYLAEVKANLEPAQDLLRFLKENEPDQGFKHRIPIGLTSEGYIPSGETSLLKFSPQITLKVKYLLLSEETAVSFDIVQFMLGNILQSATNDSIPCETFSVKYYANNPEKILNIQGWVANPLTPAHRVTMTVRNITNELHLFRGILWADAK